MSINNGAQKNLGLVGPDHLSLLDRPVSSFYEELGLTKDPLSEQDGYQVFPFSNPKRFQFPLKERETSFVALFDKSRPNQLVWKAKRPIISQEVKHIFSFVKDLEHSVHINTGTHGDEQGLTAWDLKDAKKVQDLAHSFFLNQDLRTACEDGNTSLQTISSYAPPIYPLGANHVIDAWCYSFLNTRAMPLVCFEHEIKERYRIQSEIPLLISDIGHTLSIDSS